VTRVHRLERTQRLPGPPAEVFPFFGSARNLEAITPPWLRFRVITPEPLAMGPGTLIEYRLRLHGVPLRWLTRIETWEPGVRFVDRQVRGPYRIWHHTHAFAPDPDAGGTLMTDTVRYALPLGVAGALARPWVARDLRAIFDYRAAAVAAQLPRSAPL
jgi:ligand-binding SRPBCC domain-containing protein